MFAVSVLKCRAMPVYWLSAMPVVRKCVKSRTHYAIFVLLKVKRMTSLSIILSKNFRQLRLGC